MPTLGAFEQLAALAASMPPWAQQSQLAHPSHAGDSSEHFFQTTRQMPVGILSAPSNSIARLLATWVTGGQAIITRHMPRSPLENQSKKKKKKRQTTGNDRTKRQDPVDDRRLFHDVPARSVSRSRFTKSLTADDSLRFERARQLPPTLAKCLTSMNNIGWGSANAFCQQSHHKIDSHLTHLTHSPPSLTPHSPHSLTSFTHLLHSPRSITCTNSESIGSSYPAFRIITELDTPPQSAFSTTTHRHEIG